MDEQLKKRLIGAAVLAALAVIFIPMLLESPPERPPLGALPPPPPRKPFDSALLREPVPPPARVAPLVASPPEQKPEASEPPAAPVAASPAEVEKPRNEPAPRTGLAAWVVQVGSFSRRENAKRLVAKLRKAGFQVLDPERIELRGRVLYRVQVGPMLEKSAAEAMVPRVDKIAGTKAKVRSYP